MAAHVIDNPSDSQSDVWSEWLLHRRHADDPAFAHIVRAEVGRYVDRVLDAARLTAGMTLADIGAGEGTVAFRAIDRVGPSLRVLLTDISAALLAHAETLAIERRVQQQCTFLHCRADQLTDISDASVDVLTSRAVLAYVADKSAALREFRRILKPGGRISIAEPILQDDAFMATASRTTIETTAVQSQDRFLPLLHRWKAAQYPDTHEKSPIVRSLTIRDAICSNSFVVLASSRSTWSSILTCSRPSLPLGKSFSGAHRTRGPHHSASCLRNSSRRKNEKSKSSNKSCAPSSNPPMP